MIPISKAKWKVKICQIGDFYWEAETKNKLGIMDSVLFHFESSYFFGSAKSCLKNWKKFAEINKITKWEVMR